MAKRKSMNMMSMGLARLQNVIIVAGNLITGEGSLGTKLLVGGRRTRIVQNVKKPTKIWRGFKAYGRGSC